MHILIIEDDAELAGAMADYLDLQRAECDFAYNGESGLRMALEGKFDAIILDLMLPRISGFELCEQLRQNGFNTPVLMLTAADTHSDQLSGFRAGIDDYVIKPCPMPLLWARLQALCRRGRPQSDQIAVGDLALFLKEHRATREGIELKLTPTGWKMLELLVRRSPEVVSRPELEDHVWPDGDVDVRNFNVQLHHLRKAIDKPFSYQMIQTIVGVGLCLRERPEGGQEGV